MAIYSSVPPPSQQPAATSTSAVDIEAWTVSALQSLSVSPSARSTGVTLSIPLDMMRERERKHADGAPARAAYKPRKDQLLRRDSQRRREALLKGKEGSRRRQRWENGELRRC
jgi:R3H-associated N-terminal domain